MTSEPSGRPDRASEDRASEDRASGADPAHPGTDADHAPLHPALVPRGEAIAWSATGSLLAGPIVWGAIGFGLDRLLGTGRLCLAIGAVAGSLLGFWIVYLRFGRGEEDQRPPHRR